MSSPEIVHRVASQWVEHDNARAAAAIAFFALFTLAPTLVFAVTAASWFVGAADAEQAAFDRLAEVVGTQGADLARAILDNADFVQHGLAATLVSAALLVYGASAMFVEIRSALNTIFGANAGSARRQLVITLEGRLLGAACVILVGLLVVSMLVLTVTLSAANRHLQELLGLDPGAWQAIVQLSSVPLTALVLAGLLKFLPAARPPWRHVWPGVLVGVVLFEIGKWLIAFYLSHSFIASAYGPSSSVVAVVLWIYYTTQILLLAGEVCKASMDRRRAPTGSSKVM